MVIAAFVFSSVACRPSDDAERSAAGGTAGRDESTGGTGGTGETGGDDGAGGTGGDDGTGGTGGVTPPRPGRAMLIRPTSRLVLVDTADPQASRCGAFDRIEGDKRRLVVDLDDCSLDGAAPMAAGVIGSVTVRTASTDTFDVRVQPSGGAPGPILTVGPLHSNTHGFITMVGDDRAFTVEVSGRASADVLVEMSAALVPEPDGGQYVHLLDRPERWFSANPNDAQCGFRNVWPKLESVHWVPVVRGGEGATGMFGAVHLGPHEWRDAPITFHMGPAGEGDDVNTLSRWVSTPTDAHFPWTWTSFFATGASAAQEIELRASSEAINPWELGPEPWVDAVGWLSPRAGLVYRPLDVPLEFDPVVTVTDQDVRFETGIPEAKGVVGSLVFDIPEWSTDPSQPPYRWFHVMVADKAASIPTALGGCIEDFDWMTAALHQNGRVTTQFVSRTDDLARFVMRHYTYVSGLTHPVDESLFDVTVRVRIDGVLTNP
ncbi:hypothetical protein [Vulgatibacter incomptus]|uniref:Flagellar basal-body rod modification protein FlgD n=1 Tax=Vulgatibacter incomptus TaxID=1391653 RepID=A0A0K1PCD9_9BACT|nr:hypothetical protein [Vulgatibacter incomptus]AKU91185.1 Flagellar basal-body rod modification protein FlgD [Vulgatibacter incomptus]